MENDCAWHGRAPTQDEFTRAVQELEEGLDA